MKSSYTVLIVLNIACSCSVFAQVNFEPLNYSLRSYNAWNTPKIQDSQRVQVLHPNIMSDLNGGETFYRSYIPVNSSDSSFLLNRTYKEHSWFHRKLVKENFIIIDTGLLYLTIDPLFNFSGGKANFKYKSSSNLNDVNGSKTISTNTRGLLLRADIGKKFSLESYFYENQSVFSKYMTDYVEEYNVIPGQGRVKTFKESGFDYAQSGGYFSYAPWSRFNLQVGHHKFFIGDGYRSLFLSDNSFNFPFLRMNLWLIKNKLSYSVIYASLQNLNRLPTPALSESPFERKGATFHTIEFQVADWLKLNYFQGMIWKTMDTTGERSLDYNMINPLAFVNPLIYGLDDQNNAVLGLGFKAKPLKRTTIYGQFVVDDNDFNRYGMQLGAYHFFTPKLRLMAEWNKVQPYTYSYSANNRQSYTHYNQALAHPLGAGFSEFIIMANYRYKRLLLEFQFNLANIHAEGSNVFEGSNYVQVVVPGGVLPRVNQDNFGSRLRTIKLEIAYLINPATNAKLFFNITDRLQQFAGRSQIVVDPMGGGNNSDKFFYLGLRTDLRNLYYDF